MEVYCSYGKEEETMKMLNETFIKYSKFQNRTERLQYLGMIARLQQIVKKNEIETGCSLQASVHYEQVGDKIKYLDEIQYLDVSDIEPKIVIHGECDEEQVIIPTSLPHEELCLIHGSIFQRLYIIYENASKEEILKAKYLKINELEISSLNKYVFPSSIVSLIIENLIDTEGTSKEKFIDRIKQFITKMMGLPNLQYLYISPDGPWDGYMNNEIFIPLHEKGVEIYLD